MVWAAYRAWKSSGTTRAASTRISGGRCWLRASGSFFHRDAGVGVEIEHKAQRVDARVGAAAPLDIRAEAQHGLQPILKGLGHAPPVGLHLKPAVVGAIVGKGK